MLKLKNIKKVYELNKNQKVIALQDINMTFDHSGMIMILGKSGSGKSSLLNIIGGLDFYDDGELIINGQLTKDFNSHDWDSYRNTYIGFVFQEFYMIERMTVGENIALALEMQGYEKKDIKLKVKEVLKNVDLENYEDRKISEISGGEKQRVAIARAIVKNPQIILADEPTGNLDSKTSRVILNILKKLSLERLVIMVTHNRDMAEEYGDRIIELEDGKIIKDENKIIQENERLFPMVLKYGKIPLSSSFQFVMSSLFVKKARLVFMLLLFTFSLLFVSIGTSFSFYDTGKVAVNTFTEAGVKTIPLIKYKYIKDGLDGNKILSFSEEDIAKLQSDNPSIYFLKSVIESQTIAVEPDNLFTLPIVVNSNQDANGFDKITLIDNNQNPVTLLYGTYPVQKGDILITDYMAHMIIKYNVIPVNQFSELLGKELSFWNQNFIIAGIVKTDYQEQLGKSGFFVPQQQEYRQMFMSEETFNETYQTASILIGIRNKTISAANNQYSSHIIGKLPESNNEIALTLTELTNYIPGLVYDEDQDTAQFKKYLNSDITLDLSAYGKGETNFKLVGIIDNHNEYRADFDFIVNQSMFDYFEFNNPVQGKIMTLTAVFGNNKAENKTFIYSLTNSNIRYITIYSEQFYSLRDQMGKVSNITDVVGLIFAGFASLLIYTFILNNINYKRKEIGLLKALGTGKRDIIKIFILESFFIFIIVNILTFVASLVVIRWINQMTSLDWKLMIKFFYVNYLSVGSTIALSIVIMFISTIFPLYRISKITPINAIKKGE